MSHAQPPAAPGRRALAPSDPSGVRTTHAEGTTPVGAAAHHAEEPGLAAEPDAGTTAAAAGVRPEDVMVGVRGARKTYGDVHALDGVSLDLARGDFLVLLGPSGSGKSTLLRALSGVERLDAGTITLDGRVVSGPGVSRPPETRDLGMVFQDYALWPHLTVRRNVAYALRRRRLTRSTVTDKVDAILDRVGLDGFGDRYPNQLSGGQQQRVSLARALVGEPSLVLFDEPLSNLDADLRERLRLEIGTLTREVGSTAVYITHDQSEAFALADVMGVLDRGRLVQLDRPEAVYQHPATPFVADFTGVAGHIGGVLERRFDTAYGLVRVEGGQLTVRTHPSARPGDAVTIYVRPAGARITGSPAATPDGAPAGNLLEGRVVDVAYRGRAYDHVVSGPWGRLSGVADRRAHERGHTRLLSIRQSAAIAFPRDA